MMILAIDPGNQLSAWLLYASESGFIGEFGKDENWELLHSLHKCEKCHLVIEMMACYGMPVGREVLDTCVWIGRFVERFDGPFSLIYRKDVKMHLCGSMKAKDANIRQALLDRIGPQGTKKAPGPTYGISKDVWSALAIAVTWADLNCQKEAQRAAV